MKMRTLIHLIKKYKKEIAIALGVLIIPLMVVHFLFKWKTGVYLLEAEWTAGEVLDYIGTVLAFVGTMALSLLALRVSKEANKISQRVTEIEQNRYKLELRPFVLVSSWHAFELTSEEIQINPQKKYIQIGDFNEKGALGLSITLTNSTNSFVSVEYRGGKLKDRVWKNSAVNQSNLKMNLSAGDSDEFIFYATQEDMKELVSSPVEIELYLENRFSQRYKERFTIMVASLSYLPSYSQNEWFCHVYARDYALEKYISDEDGIIVSIPEDVIIIGKLNRIVHIRRI